MTIIFDSKEIFELVDDAIENIERLMLKNSDNPKYQYGPKQDLGAALKDLREIREICEGYNKIGLEPMELKFVKKYSDEKYLDKTYAFLQKI